MFLLLAPNISFSLLYLVLLDFRIYLVKTSTNIEFKRLLMDYIMAHV